MRKFFSAGRAFALALALGLSGAAASAQAVDVITIWGEPAEVGGYGFAPDAEAQLQGLMAPIAPFVAAGAPNTTMISQIGTVGGLQAQSTVAGESNFSYIQQTGANNRATQAIVGNNTALLLNQSGENNSVIQASVGNDNFQLLDVGGQGNNVAYLQAGNELAGALQVSGHNSAVIAVQTPSSNNYLMPVGLGNLQNQVVVIVPGRMYVFNL